MKMNFAVLGLVGLMGTQAQAFVGDTVAVVLSPVATVAASLDATIVGSAGGTSVSSEVISAEAKLAAHNAVPEAVAVLEGQEAGALFVQAVAQIESESGVAFHSLEDAATSILDIASRI